MNGGVNFGDDYLKLCGDALKQWDKNKDGKTTVNELMKDSVFNMLDQSTIDKTKSIYQKYAQQDGDDVLSPQEYAEASNSKEMVELIEEVQPKIDEYVKAKQAENEKRNEEIQKSFIEAKNLKNLCLPRDAKTSEGPDSPRDAVVVEYGEWFANEVYDPMVRMADEALEYMENNAGLLENFSFKGIPFGVKILHVGSSTSYDDNSNDVMSIVEGKPQVSRYPDSVQALVLFEFQGKKYTILSDKSSNNFDAFSYITAIVEDYTQESFPVEKNEEAG